MPARTLLRFAASGGPLICFLAGPLGTSAQIATDRPDFVESSLTVGRRAVQIETSLAVDDVGWSTPTLLRVGIGPTLELRFESEVVSGLRTSQEVTGAQALSESYLGLKWHVSDQDDTAPSTAVLIHAGLPGRASGLEGSGPSLRVVAEWNVAGGLAVGLMPGLAMPSTEGRRHARGILGLVLGKEISSTLRTFGEVALEGGASTFNTGLALLLSERTQVDLGLSLRAAGDVPRAALATGFSHRMAW